MHRSSTSIVLTYLYVCVERSGYTSCCYTVSNQIVAEDVHNLRAGLEDVKVEKDKEPDNFILFISST